MEYVINICTLNNLEELIQIGKETYIDTFQIFCKKNVMEEYIEKAFSNYQILKELENKESEFYFIRNENELVGYLKINIGNAQTEFQTEDSLEIERIYIRNKYRGKKIGYKLIEHGIQRALELNKKEIWLGVWEKNQNAIEFYKKCGFEINGQHSFYMGNEKQNDYIMKRKIGEDQTTA
jgi:ribosomal protein S18 acetylase RimI-like enzyme